MDLPVSEVIVIGMTAGQGVRTSRKSLLMEKKELSKRQQWMRNLEVSAVNPHAGLADAVQGNGMWLVFFLRQ